MVYSLQQRLDKLGQRMRFLNVELVTVRRGALSITGLRASPILTDVQEIIPGVAVTQIRYQDWVIDSEDYNFGTGRTVPQIGDYIDRSNGERYQVVSLGENDPPYKYTTSTKKRIRVHSEHIGATP